MKTMNKTIIIGIGTGRCGTKSLATLLNSCNNSVVYHEYKAPKGILPFDLEPLGCVDIATRRYNEIKNFNGLFVGDVAMYYLNYIEILYDIAKTEKDNFKVICMIRDKQETVKSYLKKTEIGTQKPRHHWIKNPEKYGFQPNVWDKAFPKYDIVDRKQALEKYWDDYYKKVATLEKQGIPILLVNVKSLNNIETQKELFDFIGIKEKDRKYLKVDENKLLRR